MRVSIQTLGCRVNQYDSDRMRGQLEPHAILTDSAPDIVVLNACTVTSLAERKARQSARRVKREHPNAKVVLIGCLADAVEQGTTQFADADVLAGNAWKPHIAQLLAKVQAGASGIVQFLPEHGAGSHLLITPLGRVRAYLKIQDGCDRACTYCRATQVRGDSRSRPVQDVIEEAQDLAAAGYPEIVITGIDLAQYAPRDGKIHDALAAIASLDGIVRVRMGSLNLSGVTPELIEVTAAFEAVSPHFHIPLQSGDDSILTAMQRGYRATDYRDAIERIRAALPHATFGTDIIVGFPGETEAAFIRTCSLVREIGFSNLHRFRYSPRRGTRAAEFPGQVSPAIKKQRAERLRTQWEASVGEMLDNRIGSTQDVLVEEHRDTMWRGYTHDYLYVNFPAGQDIPVGSLISVRFVKRTGTTLEGVVDHRTDSD